MEESSRCKILGTLYFLFSLLNVVIFLSVGKMVDEFSISLFSDLVRFVTTFWVLPIFLFAMTMWKMSFCHKRIEDLERIINPQEEENL